MSDLELRVKALEDKVRVLEESLDALKNKGISAQDEGTGKPKKKNFKLFSFINPTFDTPSSEFDREIETAVPLGQAKRTIEDQIQDAVRDAAAFSEALADDPRFFNYELESGLENDPHWNQKNRITALLPFVKKGIRITSYNGFDTDIAVIPDKIDGRPVVSIGEKAFMNSKVSEVILPKSVKAILGNAFQGCSRLKHIDFPSGTEYIGSSCFADSGIEKLSLPGLLTNVPEYCCDGCRQLQEVVFGPRTAVIGIAAFKGCTKLHEVSFPESLHTVGSLSFNGTSIETMVFPSDVKFVSNETFGKPFARGREVTCVFLGRNTVVNVGNFQPFTYVTLIYCLPGSKVQEMARKENIPMKPLNEFRMSEI